VDQRIKMAARYAALEGGLSASAYSAAVVATLGSAGGASPVMLPAAGAQLAEVVNLDEDELWTRLASETGDLSDIVNAARRVAEVDGVITTSERLALTELEKRVSQAGAHSAEGS
jgi:hypothetical protein